jgi:hypothetical protein
MSFGKTLPCCHPEAQTVEIIWPSGQHDALKNLKANNT